MLDHGRVTPSIRQNLRGILFILLLLLLLSLASSSFYSFYLLLLLLSLLFLLQLLLLPPSAPTLAPPLAWEALLWEDIRHRF